MMRRILLCPASLGLGGLAALSLGSYVAWGFPWELLSHFRVQYLGLAIAGLVLMLLISRSGWALPLPYLGAALLVVGLNAVDIIPWYGDYPQRIEPSWRNWHYVNAQFSSPHLRFFSANVHVDNTRYDQTIAIAQAQEPDLALFIEVTPDWVNQLQAGLGDRLPYGYTVYSTGMLIMSRLPLTQTQTLRTGASGDFSLLATFKLADQPIQFIGIHPMVPLQPAAFEQRNAAFQTLAEHIQSLTTPVIVMGDFNLSPWSPYYRQFIQQTHLHNASLGFGVQPSFPRPSTVRPRPSWLLPLINIPIDHCLVSRPFRVTGFVTAAHGNADHAPIVVDLVWSPSGVRRGLPPKN